MDKIRAIALSLRKDYNPKKFLEVIKKGMEDSLLEKQLLNKAEEVLKECEKKGWWVKTLFERDFPSDFFKIENPPFVLFGIGNQKFGDFNFGIIGTRKPTVYGKKNARIFARQLAEGGLCIVSGGARGIDTEIHKGVLEVRGRTICILGSGFKHLYPPENRSLFGKIVDNGGTILTEFPPDTRPFKYNFPFRNRLISAISKGVLVIEASMKSGTFSTVNWALSQGKEIFALPGPVDSKQSEGTNYLIKEGAHCVISPTDILSFYGIETNRRKIRLTKEEESILAFLKNPKDIEELVEITGKPLPLLYTIIFSLQIKGVVQSLPGGKYTALI